MVSLTHLRALFVSLNRRYFNSTLPSSTLVRWGSKKEMSEKIGKKRISLWGYAINDGSPRIVISEEMRNRKKAIIAGELPPLLPELMLHEMQHLADKSRAAHGKEFRKGMRRLVNAGGFGKIN